MSQPLLNLGQLWERVDGDPELLQALVEIYRAETPALLAKIHDGIVARKADVVESAAHCLKGSTGVFSAARALTAVTTLEQLGRSGDFKDAAAAYEDMVSAVDDLLRALEGLAAEGPPPPSS